MNQLRRPLPPPGFRLNEADRTRLRRIAMIRSRHQRMLDERQRAERMSVLDGEDSDE